MAANAGPLDVHPQRGFVVGGFSAGSTFAAVISQLARDEDMQPPITGQLLSLPSVLHRSVYPEQFKHELLSIDQNANAPVINLKSLDIFEGQHFFHQIMTSIFAYIIQAFYKVPDWRDHRASPLLHPNLSGLPKAYFQITGLDPLRDEAFLYEKLLKEKNTTTKADVYPGLPHTFWTFPGLRSSASWMVDTVNGVKWLLE